MNQTTVESFIAAQFEHQLIAVNPAATGVADLDTDLIAVNAVGAIVLTIGCRSDPDVTDRAYLNGVEHDRQPVNQMRLNDGASAASHHGQVHHQTEGFPVHQVGGCAVVGAGKIFRLFDPTGASNPQPTAGGQGFFLGLHPSQQLHLAVVQLS